METTPIQKKKIQRILVLVMLAVIFITTIVIWWGFFDTSSVVPEEGILPSQHRIYVDTSILSHPLLKELDEPRAETKIPSEIGRENPLLPSF